MKRKNGGDGDDSAIDGVVLNIAEGTAAMVADDSNKIDMLEEGGAIVGGVQQQDMELNAFRENAATESGGHMITVNQGEGQVNPQQVGVNTGTPLKVTTTANDESTVDEGAVIYSVAKIGDETQQNVLLGQLPPSHDPIWTDLHQILPECSSAWGARKTDSGAMGINQQENARLISKQGINPGLMAQGIMDEQGKMSMAEDVVNDSMLPVSEITGGSGDGQTREVLLSQPLQNSSSQPVAISLTQPLSPLASSQSVNMVGSGPVLPPIKTLVMKNTQQPPLPDVVQQQWQQQFVTPQIMSSVEPSGSGNDDDAVVTIMKPAQQQQQPLKQGISQFNPPPQSVWPWCFDYKP